MSTSRPTITSHRVFHSLSNEFFNPYPPYVLVNSEADAQAVLSTGCESEYLVVLDAKYVFLMIESPNLISNLHSSAPPDTKSLTSDNIEKYKERIGILICTLPSGSDLPTLANHLSTLLATGGTMIGFGSPQQSGEWKQACTEWAAQQKTQDVQGQERDGIALDWSMDDAKDAEWGQWSVVKKAPELERPRCEL
jgi:hypothetical protein